MILILLVSCSGSGSGDDDTLQASGFIEGRVYTLASSMGGRIDEILVSQGEVVEAGDQLIILDSTQLDYLRDQAQAAVEAILADISALEDRPSSVELAEVSANVEIALAELNAAEAALDLLNASYEPLDPPEIERNAAEAAIVVAGAGLTLAQAQLAQVEAGPLEGEEKVLEALLSEAEANLDLVTLQLEELNLIAPADGIIQEVLHSEGEVATPGSPIAYLMTPEHLTLTLYIPVKHITTIEYGMEVEITADSYPDEVFIGSVSNIADEAQFTPATVLTEEERVKLVFAVEVLIDDPTGKLKPGMPVDAVITP
jgi:HlyD family secretion protein